MILPKAFLEQIEFSTMPAEGNNTVQIQNDKLTNAKKAFHFKRIVQLKL